MKKLKVSSTNFFPKLVVQKGFRKFSGKHYLKRQSYPQNQKIHSLAESVL